VDDDIDLVRARCALFQAFRERPALRLPAARQAGDVRCGDFPDEKNLELYYPGGVYKQLLMNKIPDQGE
jgi:hypothetical protein